MPAMGIIEFIRDRARFYNCPVCGRSLKGCDVQVLSHEEERFHLQVTCAQCQVTFIVVLTIAGAAREEISLTGSGTEAVNLAVFGVAHRMSKRGAIVTWAAEHQSVLGAARRLQAQGHLVEVAKVDGFGQADPEAIPSSAALVSIGLANNEIGTIQPVAAIIPRAHQVGALVHVDACAGPRWIGIPAGADLVSLSGYKLGAGRGGVLFVQDGVRIDPLLYGGPQEWARRAGPDDGGAGTAVAG